MRQQQFNGGDSRLNPETVEELWEELVQDKERERRNIWKPENVLKYAGVY